MKLGLMVFANDSGLGAQTRRLSYMLQPSRVLAIDASGFSKNKQHHFEWYKQFQGYKVYGFPTNHEIDVFLQGLTHVLVCENPLNTYLLTAALRKNIRVYIQSNYEFCDHLDKNLPLPHRFLMPSYWMVDDMKRRFGDERVVYCPPPIDQSEFAQARDINLRRNQERKRILHIVGTLAASDRNGTLDLLEAMQSVTADYELVIRSQHALPEIYTKYASDRISFVVKNEFQQQDMYKDFDFMILPRRYGGLSLTTNEALSSGLPVLMPDISPNNQWLPEHWIYPAYKKDTIFTRTFIDVYASEVNKLASFVDNFCTMNLSTEKQSAVAIAQNELSTESLLPKYEALW